MLRNLKQTKTIDELKLSIENFYSSPIVGANYMRI